MKIVKLSETKILNQINYLESLVGSNSIQEELKQEGIDALKWILALSYPLFGTDRFIKEDFLSKELNYLDAEMTKYDYLQDYLVSCRIHAKLTQIEWVMTFTEKMHDSEVSVPEIDVLMTRAEFNNEYPDFPSN